MLIKNIKKAFNIKPQIKKAINLQLPYNLNMFSTLESSLTFVIADDTPNHIDEINDYDYLALLILLNEGYILSGADQNIIEKQQVGDILILDQKQYHHLWKEKPSSQNCLFRKNTEWLIAVIAKTTKDKTENEITKMFDPFIVNINDEIEQLNLKLFMI